MESQLATLNSTSTTHCNPRKRKLRLCTGQAKISRFESNPFKVVEYQKKFPLGIEHQAQYENSNFSKKFNAVKRSNTFLKKYPGYNPCSPFAKDVVEPSSASSERTATYHHNEIFDENYKFQTLSTKEIQDLEDSANLKIRGKVIPLKSTQTMQLKISLKGLSRWKNFFLLYLDDGISYLGSVSIADLNFCSDVGSHVLIILFSVFGIDVLQRDKSLFSIMVPFVLCSFFKLIFTHYRMTKIIAKRPQKSDIEIRCYTAFNQFKFAFELHFLVSLFRNISIFKDQFANRDCKYDNLTILELGAVLIGCLFALLKQIIPNMCSSQKIEADLDNILFKKIQSMSHSLKKESGSG